MSSSSINPTAGAFTPSSTSTGHLTFDELRIIQSTLCKALADEREAHKATRVALEQETKRRVDAENAQLLGSVVKQNATHPELTATKPSVFQNPVAKNAVPARGSILYDVLEQQKTTYEKEGFSGDSEEDLYEEVSHSGNVRATAKKQNPYDLEELLTAKLDDVSNNHAMDCRLRRHFLAHAEDSSTAQHVEMMAGKVDLGIKLIDDSTTEGNGGKGQTSKSRAQT